MSQEQKATALNEKCHYCITWYQIDWNTFSGFMCNIYWKWHWCEPRTKSVSRKRNKTTSTSFYIPPTCLSVPGYCGADIKAVCSESALCALRRRYPQIYSSSQKLVLDVDSIAITSKDFMSAMSNMVPASQRYNQTYSIVKPIWNIYKQLS